MQTMIIGYGNLGKIYAATFLKNKLVEQHEQYIFCKRAQQAEVVNRENHGIAFFASDHREIKPDVILLAVKPQDATSIYDIAKKYIGKNTLVISVMAGINLDTLRQSLGHEKIIRAMPNAAVGIGMGITGYAAATALHKTKKVETLLAGTGKIIRFEDENLLNALTAMSGSGPAYFFYFMQAMTEAGKQLGFEADISAQLVKQTMLGAFHLFGHSEYTLDELIGKVASKGGTTEAALKIFEQGKLKETLINGIVQACLRSEELSNRH